MSTARAGLASLVLWAFCSGTVSAEPVAPQVGTCVPCTPVTPQRLAQARGGFDFGGKLQASFGIQRAVYINGQLVAEQSVHLADLSRVTAAQAQTLQNALAGMTFVNNGRGDVTATQSPMQGIGSTVIQNAADGQSIRSLTVLNISANSLQLLRNASVGAALSNALAQPLGPR